MDRQTRLLLILVAVLLALVALDRWWEAPDPLGNPEATARVWSVEEPDIARIEAVRADGASLVFVRTEEGWTVEAPFVGKANQRVVSRIARVLAEVEMGEPLEGVDDPALFGLGDPPRIEVSITRADGTTAEIDVGDSAPTGWRTYVRGEEGLAVIDGELETSLFLPADELRDRHLLDYDPAEVHAVRITSEAGVLGLTGEGREWWVDGYGRADLDAVEGLVAGLLDLQVEAFLDDALADGVVDPEKTVVIERHDGPSIEVRVGQRTPLGQVVDVVGGLTGAVPPDALLVLGQPPTSVADPLAVPIRQVKPRQIDVALGDGSWAVDFGPDGWTRTGDPDRAAFDAVEILRGIQTAPQLDPVPEPTETYGRVVLTDAEGRERVIRFGQRIGDKRVVVDEAGGAPYFALEAGVQAAASPFADEG